MGKNKIGRPYLHLGIDQLIELYENSKGEREMTNLLLYELEFRNVSKARAFKTKINKIGRKVELEERLEEGFERKLQFVENEREEKKMPEKVIVECGYCKHTNIVQVIDGIQYLSCKQCHGAYTAEFKYNILRTVFQSADKKKVFTPLKITLVFLVLTIITMLFFFFKNSL